MGKTLKYVSEFTFPSAGKTAAPGYAKGGMAMGSMKSTKPAASPAPKSDMLYSKKENTAKTLLSDGKGAPMPHAKGSVNMAKGGTVMPTGRAAMAQVAANRQAPQAPANVKPPMPQMVKPPVQDQRSVQAQPTRAQPMTNVKPPMPGTTPNGVMPRLPQSMPGTTPNGVMPGGAADQMRPAVMKRGGMAKVNKVMGEFKAGELHSGSKSGPVVKSRKQAVAIGMSEARKATKK